MPLINLLHHIQRRSGIWQDEALLKDASKPFVFTLADTCAPDRLMLRWQHDCVVLVGPLRVRVTFQSENLLFGLSSLSELQCDPANLPGTTTTAVTTVGALALDTPPGALGLCASTVYSYVVDIAAGQAWPFILNELVRAIANNFGVRVLIEPALETATSAAPARDLPCDFAVADVPDTARFFPAACEPCTPGALIGLPPSGPTLAIPAADGGCVRPRYFNGMFITREDLETEQRYFRLKQKLQNRAAGAGVVWGLAVGRQGSAVCVAPGYAVDCCGNDLTVTTPYKVEIATLLRDPAAIATLASAPALSLSAPVVRAPPTSGDATGVLVGAAGRLAVADAAVRRGTRMHLLLEYIECPSDPRPVHADPCGGTASLCEMSRVRETVRLRLVPPRDLPRSGPIQKFLDQVAGLRTKYKLDDKAIPPVADTPPFRIQIEWTGPVVGAGTNTSSNEFEPGKEPGTFGTGAIQSVKIRLRMSGPTLFTGGQLEATDLRSGALLLRTQLAPDGLNVDLPEVSVTGDSGQIGYKLIDWRAQAIFAVTGDVVLGGNVNLVIGWASTANGGQFTVPATPSNRAVERFTVTAIDVCADPCASPVTRHLPWLHDDPIDPSRAGDPKALLLAMLGGWLAKQLAAFGTGEGGATGQVTSVQRTIARALYEAAWLLFYGVQQGPQRFDIGTVMRDLFRGWCEALLWRGPSCDGEPHGVVIGCALVAGGTITEIDPLGGRRWVLHGPLLSHWAGQLGAAPLDVTMSRLIDGLCCVASLPAIGATTAMQPIVIDLRAGAIAFGAPAAVIDELSTKHGVKTITGSTTVSFPELVARAIEGASRAAEDVDPSVATRYTLGAPLQDRVLSVFLFAERNRSSTETPGNR